MRRLESYRPTASTDEWGQAERAAALDIALHAPRSTWTGHAPISRQRRWLTVAGGVAAVGVAVLVIELIPSGDHRQPAGGTGGLGTQTAISNPVPSSRVPSSGPTAMSSDSATPAPLPHGPVGRLAAAARATSLGNPQDGQYWYHKVDLYQPAGRASTDDRRQQHELGGSQRRRLGPGGRRQRTVVHLLPVPRHAEPQPPEHRLPQQPAHRPVRARHVPACARLRVELDRTKRSSSPSPTRCTTTKVWCRRTCVPPSSRYSGNCRM